MIEALGMRYRWSRFLFFLSQIRSFLLRWRQHHRRPSAPKVHFPRLRLSGQTVQTRLPPQRLRRYLLPPLQTPNQTDEIFLAQILGHKLLGPNASLSVGQSYKDFYIRKP
jgi:hypothetical protein